MPDSIPSPAELVGQRIQAALTRLNLSQADLAQLLDVHESTVSLWISGRRGFNVGRLTQIAEALGIKAGELLPEGHSCTAGA